MPLILPSFNDLVKSENLVYQTNVQYNPVYNQIYDIKPKTLVEAEELEKNISIFDLTLTMILKNIANSILLFILDLVRPSTYTSFANFTSIFFKESRLMYLGISTIVIAVFILIFTK